MLGQHGIHNHPPLACTLYHASPSKDPHKEIFDNIVFMCGSMSRVIFGHYQCGCYWDLFPSFLFFKKINCIGTQEAREHLGSFFRLAK